MDTLMVSFRLAFKRRTYTVALVQI